MLLPPPPAGPWVWCQPFPRSSRILTEHRRGGPVPHLPSPAPLPPCPRSRPQEEEKAAAAGKVRTPSYGLLGPQRARAVGCPVCMEARGLLLSSSKKPPIPRQRRPRAASSKAGHRGRGRGRGRTSLQGEDVAASSFQCQGLQPAFPGKAAARGTAWSEGPGRTGPPPPPPPPGRPPGLPPGPMTLRCPQPRAGSDGSEGAADEQPPEPPGLAKAMRELTHTGWYWGNMTVNEAKEKLKDAPEGTFLIRDSSHSDYLLTISVKTSAGPTNLRIEYQDGKFRLDSIICIKSRLKQFDSVAHLIEYYVRMCKDKRTGSETPRNGTVHLYLTKPLYTSTPSLQHLCRLTINKCTSKIWELPLPTRLKDYLKEYQYQV